MKEREPSTGANAQENSFHRTQLDRAFRGDTVNSRILEGEEVKKNRTAHQKVYDLGRGVYQYVLFPEMVHYQDETGQWQDIDNTLVDEKENGHARLVNKRNAVTVSLASEADAGELVRLTNRKGQSIAWEVKGANTRLAAAVPTDTEKLYAQAAAALEKARAQGTLSSAAAPETNGAENDAQADESALSEEAFELLDYDAQRKSPRTLESCVRYDEILPSVDMICHMHGAQFKDAFVLKTPEAPSQIVLTLKATSGLTWRGSQDGMIQAMEGDQAAFTLPPAFATDANGQEGSVTTRLMQEGAETRLVLSVDRTWLDQAAYPITIDPVVNTPSDAGTFEDNYVSLLSPNTVINDAANKLRVSNTDASGRCRSFIKVVQLPEISSAFTITKAMLTLNQLIYTDVQSFPVFYREVIEPWSANSITWNNQPAVADKDVDFIMSKYVDAKIVGGVAANQDLDVTSLARKWYKGANHGIRLDTRAVPNTTRILDFQSSKHTTYKPILTLTCVANVGLVGHTPYESMGGGSAGTGHINLFNGNFVFTRGMTHSTGNRMPVSLTATYNSCPLETPEASVPMGGCGWRMSCDVQVFERKVGTEVYYELVQGDGSSVDLRRKNLIDKIYYDLLGMGLSLQWNKPGDYNNRADFLQIEDKSGNIMKFDWPASNSEEGSPLLSIADPRASSVKFLYFNKRLAYVIDGADRKTALYYQNGRLHRIVAPGEIDGVYLNYDAEGYLTGITDVDGTVSTYTYANGRLVSSHGYEGLRLDCTYEAGAPHRAVSLAIAGVDAGGEMAGNRRSYQYGDGMTISRDETVANGKRKFYTFNAWGNQVGIRDELGFAGFAKYNPDSLPNHPELVSKLIKTASTLYVEDSRFDTNAVFDLASYSYDTSTAYMGPRSLKIIKQLPTGQVKLPYATRQLKAGNQYILSAYTKTSGAVSCYASAAFPNALGQTLTFSGDRQRCTDEWDRVSVSFSIPADAGDAGGMVSAALSFSVTEGVGNVWLDCVQLEQGDIVGSYNLLCNADFSAHTNGLPNKWVALTDNTAADHVYLDEAGEAGKPDCLTPGVLRLFGDIDKTKGIYQEMAVSGVQGDVFVFGGWAHGYSKSLRANPGKYGIRIAFKLPSGNIWSDGGKAGWNEEWSQWQFTSGVARATAAYSAIRFYIEYEKNINHVDIDGLMLYKEGFGKAFGYDDKGNILNMTDLSSKKLYATYDSYNNLTSYRAIGKSSYSTFSYNGPKRLLTERKTAGGQQQDYVYDACGNLTQQRVYTTTYDESTGETRKTGFIAGKMQYTADGNFLAETSDARNKTTRYLTDTCLGTLQSVQTPDGQLMRYEYDGKKRLIQSSTEQEGKLYQNTYTYDKGRVRTVSHNTTTDEPDVTYSFAYDKLGNPTETKVGNQLLSRNVFRDAPDRLPERMEYGNGDKVRYAYDDYKRLSSIRYDQDSETTVEYQYGSNGKIQKVLDRKLRRTEHDVYDGAERLAEHRVYDTSATDGIPAILARYQLSYDDCNRVSKIKETVEGTPYETSFAYTNDDLVSQTQYGNSNRYITQYFDGYSRLSSERRPYGYRYYTYHSSEYPSTTTTLVSKITELGKAWEYAYDDVGNILSVRHNNSDAQVLTYQYDRLGQLLRANDPVEGKTWTYAYDQGGNLLARRT